MTVSTESCGGGTAMEHDEKIIRLRTVLARTGLSRSTLYRMIASGTFPRQQRIGIQATGWYQSEVEQWIADPLGYRERYAVSTAYAPERTNLVIGKSVSVSVEYCGHRPI